MLYSCFTQKYDNVFNWFYSQVEPGAVWDIKLEHSWVETIGTPYPGTNANVIFRGHKIAIDDLGNFTYGYIGRALGIPLWVLLAGSAYAARHNPYDLDVSDRIINEFVDWIYIAKGFNAFDASMYACG